MIGWSNGGQSHGHEHGTDRFRKVQFQIHSLPNLQAIWPRGAPQLQSTNAQIHDLRFNGPTGASVDDAGTGRQIEPHGHTVGSPAFIDRQRGGIGQCPTRHRLRAAGLNRGPFQALSETALPTTTRQDRHFKGAPNFTLPTITTI